MPECKLKQYSSKVKKRNNNNNTTKENDVINKKSKFKNTIEIKKIKDYSDDSSLIMMVQNKTLNDSNWKDSFDRLLDTRSPLRKNNIIKKNIRLSYNLDSSVNTSNEKSKKEILLSSRNSKILTKSTVEKDKENNNKEHSNNSILNQTPLYKRKSVLNTFNNLMNKGRRGSKKVKKKSTMSSTPLVKVAKNAKRKTKKSNKISDAEIDDMFLMPTISPIRNEPSPLTFSKSLLKSFTGSEKIRVWKDLFGINLSEKYENDINDGSNNFITEAKQTTSESFSPGQTNKTRCRSRSLFKSTTENFRILNSSNVNSKNHTTNTSKSLLEVDVQNIFHDVQNNSGWIQSLDNTKNVSLSTQQVQSFLDESLSNIERSLSQFEANKSNNQLPQSPFEIDELQPVDDQTLNQTLQIIEHTYNSILEDGELMTEEISDKFLSIDKNLDNLILNNSKELNFTKTTEQNPNKNTFNEINTDTNNLFETQKKDNPNNVDVDSDIQNNINKQRNIFQNNAFINKLKFLQNCLAVGGGKEVKGSFPIVLKDNVTNLVRSSSLNALTNINTRHTLNPSSLNLKNRNNKLFMKENTLQNVINDRRNSLDSNTRILKGNFNFIRNSIGSTSTSQYFNNQLSNSTEISRIPFAHKLLQNVSNITPKINSPLNNLNKTNNKIPKKDNKKISRSKFTIKLPNLISKNITIGNSNENKSETKYTLRKYNSENFQIISGKFKPDIPLVEKFVPLRKSLIDTNSKISDISIDFKNLDENTDIDKNSNLTHDKTEKENIKENQPKPTTENQIEITSTKTSINIVNRENNEKLQVKNIQHQTSVAHKENTNIEIEGIKKYRKVIKKKSDQDYKNKLNKRKIVENNSQDNFVPLRKSLGNSSIDSNESSKHTKDSIVTSEQYNNNVVITNNDDIGTESSINQISNSDFKVSEARNRPIIIENIQIVAPSTKQAVERELDDTSDEDNNKRLSDLKSCYKTISYNTRQLRTQRKRKCQKEKNNSTIILDSPPNKLTRKNKTKKIEKHISNPIELSENNSKNSFKLIHNDTSNETTHSVSSLDISIKEDSTSKKCRSLNLPSNVDNNFSSVQYDNVSSLEEINNSKRKTMKNITKNVKPVSKNLPLITYISNSGSETDKSENGIKPKTLQYITKRNSKQKSLMLSMENEDSIEKRNRTRTSKNRPSELKSPESSKLISQTLISETETINSINCTSDCIIDATDDNLIENTLRKYNSDNFKIISNKLKTDLPLAKKFVPLRKSLIDTNSKRSNISIDSKKSDENSESDKHSNSTCNKTENDNIKESQAKSSNENQVQISNMKTSLYIINSKNNEKLQVKNIQHKTSLSPKENTNIEIEDLRKSRKVIKKKSDKDYKNKLNNRKIVENNLSSQENFIPLRKSLGNSSIDSNESSKHTKDSIVTSEQYNNNVVITNNDDIGTESSINQITNSDFKVSEVRNRPIIIENIQIVAPSTKQAVESELDDTRDEDSNKKLSDLKSYYKTISYNTRQLRTQRKRKCQKEKNNSTIILDSPPNKLTRKNKTKKIEKHISNPIELSENNSKNSFKLIHNDTSNETTHSVLSDISIKKDSKSKKSISHNLPSKLDNNFSSIEYANAFSKQNNNSKRKPTKYITRNVKVVQSLPLITQITNSDSESDKSENSFKRKSNLRKKRNSKQKSLMLLIENKESIEKRNRTSKNRSAQLKYAESSKLISQTIIPESEADNLKNSTNHSIIDGVDHNLIENNSNEMNIIQRSSYVTARRNSKKKSNTLLYANGKLSYKSDKPVESISPQINLETSSFSCLMNLELESEIPSEILNISNESIINLIDQDSINISSNDVDSVQIHSNIITKRNSKQNALILSENKEDSFKKRSKLLNSPSPRLTSEKSKSFIKSPMNEIDQDLMDKDADFLNKPNNFTKIKNCEVSIKKNKNIENNLNVTSRRNSKQKFLKSFVNMKTSLSELNSVESSKTNLESEIPNTLKNIKMYSTKVMQIDLDLTNRNSNEFGSAQRISNVTTRRNSKQKLSSENYQSNQIKISKVLNSSLNSQNSSIMNLQKEVVHKSIEHSVIEDIENVSNTNLLKSDILNKNQLKDSMKLNSSTINLSPEVTNFRTARQKSIEIRRKLARSKLSSIIGELQKNKTQDPLHTKLRKIVNRSLNKPNNFTNIKNCKVFIKKNKNIKNNLIYKPTKDSLHGKHYENNTLKVSKKQERLSIKNHRKKLPIRKCKILLLKNKIKSKSFVNTDKSYNDTISEIQLNNSVLNNDSKTITIVDSHNSTAITTATDKSVMEISFDRDEFIKNINDHHIKNSFLQTTYIKPIKQSSLSRHNSSIDSVDVNSVIPNSGPLINISNNITIRDSINQRKSDHRNSSSLITKSKNITLRDSICNSVEKSVNNKFNLIYDTLYEDLEEIQNNKNSQLLVDQSRISNNDKIQLRLSGGKWRRSLCAWRKNSISLIGKINSSQLINTEFQLQQNLSGDINKKVEISSKENTECINSGTNDTIRNSLILSSQIFNKSNSIRKESNKNLRSLSLAQTSLKDNEINFNVSQQRSSFLRKTLLLEPTDDEAPIIHKSCSLFNTFEKQSKLSSSSGNEAAETAASCVQEKQLLQLQNQQQQYLQQRTQTQQQQQNFIEKSSLLQRQSKQKPPSTSAVYSEIVEETEEEEEELHIEDDDSEYNQSDGDVEYFNDRRILNKNNSKSTKNSINKQKSDEIQNFLYVQRRATQSSNHQQRTSYQHQLSVPICGNRPSISILGQPSNRRRRTSFIEGFVDFNYHQEQRFLIDNFLKQSTTTVVEEVERGRVKGTEAEETKQLQQSTLHNKSSRYIGTYENNENHIFLPTLDVSLRAQLSPRDIVLRRCQQTDPFEFSSIYSESVLHQCRKIGEGVYGEVFMNKNQNGEAIVLKIIPIEGQIEINGEVQKNFEQILPEIIIAEELSRLRNDKKSMTSGFVEVKNVHCVQGCYPDHLIDLWELYRDNCGTENDHPEIFPEDQLYIIFELANAGQDLEAFNFQNALQSYSAFLQVALSLAVAEEKFKFEHRDLHWGNILLQSTEQKEIYFKLNGKDYKIPTHGVKATIIDYTLSRMIFEGCCLYNDLSNDNELFSASGDYQFDVYRLMQKRLDNQWENYDPYTNILWLHYTIDKMISGARYRCSKTKKHRSAIQTIMKLRDELLDYNSASDYVESFDD